MLINDLFRSFLFWNYNDMECHIEPDWLLVYQYINEELVLLLVSTGSHSELF